MKQLQDAYIVAATRTPIGRSHKGAFKHLRPDDLLAHALRAAVAQVPGLDPKAIEDVIDRHQVQSHFYVFAIQGNAAAQRLSLPALHILTHTRRADVRPRMA